jgi:prophage antirepressor-like protein
VKFLSPIENPFTFEAATVRTAIGPDGNAWFCARDVFEALDITWNGGTGSLKNLPEKWQGVLYLQTPGGVQQAIFISEPAVYKTAFSSRKPQAQRFAEWVCEEVLPSIRRQGFFGELPAASQFGARRCLLATVRQINTSADAFEQALLRQQVQDLCNQLGMTMPSLDLLGRDPRQQALPGV